MAGAIVAFDQARPSGSSAGSPGVARNDLWLGWLVTCRSTAGGNTRYAWEFLDVPPGSAVTLSGDTTANATFTPDLPGSYRIQLTTNGGGPGNVQILVAAIRFDLSGALANRGWRLPALGEVAGEDNFLGQLRGWSEAFEFIFADLLDVAESITAPDVSVAAAAVNNIDLTTGHTTIDTRALVDQDRVLLPAQTNLVENGVYVWSSTTHMLTRTVDVPLGLFLAGGSHYFVGPGGKRNAGKTFILTIGGAVGTDALIFIQQSNYYNVQQFGWRGDAQTAVVAATATAHTLTVSGLTTADINKKVMVVPDQAGSGTTYTKIDNVVGNTITLHDAIVTTCTAGLFVWGTDDTVAWQSAHDASPPTGATITAPDGGSMCGPLLFTAPIRLKANRTIVYSTGGANAWIRTNNNIVLEGQTGTESMCYPTDGHATLHLTGAWAVPNNAVGKPQCAVRSFGQTGGKRFVDTNGLVVGAGFEEGKFIVQDCTVLSCTEYMIYITKSCFYSQVRNNNGTDIWGGVWILDNTETKCSDNVYDLSLTRTGGTGIRLEIPHHVVSERDYVVGNAGTYADLWIIPGDYTGSNSPEPGAGIVTVKEMKSAGERETNCQRRSRVRIDTANSLGGVTDMTATQVHFENCHFYTQTGQSIKHIGRGTTATPAQLANVAVVETNVPHGLDTADSVHLTNTTDTSFCGGPFVVASVIDPTHFTYSNPGPNAASLALGGEIANAGLVVFDCPNPMSDSSISGCVFLGFTYGVNENYNYNSGPYGKAENNVWDASNKGVGPFGKEFYEFGSGGGKSFSRAITPPGSGILSIDSRSIQSIQSAEVRNRVKNTDLTTWINAGGSMTVTGGQDNGLDDGSMSGSHGTTAFKIARQATGNAFGESFSVGVHLWSPGVVLLHQLDLTSRTERGVIQLRGRSGNTRAMQLGLYDVTNSRIIYTETVMFFPGGRWNEYEFPFSWGASPGVVQLYMTPGPLYEEPSNCFVDAVHVSDTHGPFLPTTGSMVSDTMLGLKFTKDVAFTGIRTYNDRNHGIPTVAALSGGGTASLVAGSNDTCGQIAVNSATAASGRITLTINRKLIGVPVLIPGMQNSNQTWAAGADVRINNYAAIGNTWAINIDWNNNGVTPSLTASQFLIHYLIAYASPSGI